MDEILYMKKNGTKPLACSSPFVFTHKGKDYRYHPGFPDPTGGERAEPASVWPEELVCAEPVRGMTDEPIDF